MEQRGVLLRGIARVLNAGGSALLNVYDAASSIKAGILPGEKGSYIVQLREYEKKIEWLYSEIGKEVVFREDPAYMTAAGEAMIKRVAEYQAEIEKIRHCIQKIDAAEKAPAVTKKGAAPEPAATIVKTTPEPIVNTEDAAVTELTEDSPAATTVAMEITGAVSGEVTETPAPEMQADAVESAVPEPAADSADNAPGESAVILVATDETPVPETAAATGSVDATVEVEETETVVLEALLKSDLLQMCSEKGIEANKRMTKTAIIELITKSS